MRFRLLRPRKLARHLWRMARDESPQVEEYLATHPEEWLQIADEIPEDAADILEEIDQQRAKPLLDQLDPDSIAEVLEELDPQHAAELLIETDISKRDRVLEEMGNVEAAEILGSLTEPQLSRFLDQVTVSIRTPIEELLSYPADSAGRLMSTEVDTLPMGITAEEAMEHIRSLHRESEDLSYIYITDPDTTLIGVLSFRDLVLIEPESLVDQAMATELITVSTETDREVVAELAQRYHLLSVPVVGVAGNLIGTVTTDSLRDSIHEEASEDFAVAMGAEVDETFRSPILRSVRHRIPWIVIDLLIAIGIVFTINHFSQILDTYVVLAALMPLIARVGGDAGAQSLAVVIRGLASDSIPQRWVRRVMFRETQIGFYDGLIIGTLSAMVGWVFSDLQGEEEPQLVAIAMFVACWSNLIVAGLAGSGIPFLLRRLGLDPALGSNLIMTAVTDLVGFAGFLAVATLLLA